MTNSKVHKSVSSYKIYYVLLYCVEVWGNACDTHLDPIIKIQQKCVRVITFSHYMEPTESLFKDLKILAFKKKIVSCKQNTNINKVMLVTNFDLTLLQPQTKIHGTFFMYIMTGSTYNTKSVIIIHIIFFKCLMQCTLFIS